MDKQKAGYQNVMKMKQAMVELREKEKDTSDWGGSKTDTCPEK